MQILVPGVEPDRLEQRLIFLQDRAKAHLGVLEEAADVAGERAIMGRACAATLQRDAACIALLLGRMDDARRLLLQAGGNFLELGMPIGAGIVALADADQTADILLDYEDVVEGARQQWAPAETREREDKSRPMSERARGEPRQLLGIMQADWLMASGRAAKSFAGSEAMRVRLGYAGGYPVGATGLSIGTYVRLADELSGHREVEAPGQAWVFDSLSYFYAARSENIANARKDSFHWRMVPRPAELIDLDATILMVLVLGTTLAPILLENARRRDLPILDAPLYIAKMLRRDLDFKHHY